jgi:hypothetical protein
MFKLRNALIEFDRDLYESEPPGLSAEEVFERFADAESPRCGMDLRGFKDDLMEGLDLGSTDTVPPATKAEVIGGAGKS